MGNERGWIGMFTRASAPGALPNGTRIVKQNAEPGDGHPNGTPGVVLGSLPVEMTAPDGKYAKVGYFIEWATRPKCAVFTADYKVREADV